MYTKGRLKNVKNNKDEIKSKYFDLFTYNCFLCFVVYSDYTRSWALQPRWYRQWVQWYLCEIFCYAYSFRSGCQYLFLALFVYVEKNKRSPRSSFMYCMFFCIFFAKPMCCGIFPLKHGTSSTIHQALQPRRFLATLYTHSRKFRCASAPLVCAHGAEFSKS